MQANTQASTHAVRALSAAQLEIAFCANAGALEATDWERRLRALTLGYAAIRLGLSAFAVLDNPNSSDNVEALYGELFFTYDMSESLFGPSQWTPFSVVLSENVHNTFDPPFVQTSGIVLGDAHDSFEVWAWRNLRLYFHEARDKFEEALSPALPESERQGLCKRLVTLGVKAELAFWAMRTKKSADIVETIDEILTIEPNFIERPQSL